MDCQSGHLECRSDGRCPPSHSQYTDANRDLKIWDLFEDHHLFDGRGPDGQHSDGQLLAEMIAMIGPPSIDFLLKCPNSQKYWDDSGIFKYCREVFRVLQLIFVSCLPGQWIGSEEIPDISLEDSEVYLEGDNKEMFLKFVRRMLRWDPEERPTARDLLTDPWLTGSR